MNQAPTYEELLQLRAMTARVEFNRTRDQWIPSVIEAMDSLPGRVRDKCAEGDRVECAEGDRVAAEVEVVRAERFTGCISYKVYAARITELEVLRKELVR